jgi:hypothetical protein
VPIRKAAAASALVAIAPPLIASERRSDRFERSIERRPNER